jgi:hypothetical protein
LTRTRHSAQPFSVGQKVSQYRGRLASSLPGRRDGGAGAGRPIIAAHNPERGHAETDRRVASLGSTPMGTLGW